jgi:micrococcal nuclease
MSKRRRVLLLLLVAFVGLSFRGAGYYGVKTIFDGDTILLQNGDKIRYFGIDTPEMGEVPQFMAVEARQRNRQLVAEKRVRMEFDQVTRDRYGRRLAYVFLESGEMINAILLREGLAHVLVNGPEARYFSLLLANQRLAMGEKIGIWSRENVSREKSYIGNTRSYVFHRPGCARAREISRRNRNPFPDRLSAFREGFHPCSVCKP